MGLELTTARRVGSPAAWPGRLELAGASAVVVLSLIPVIAGSLRLLKVEPACVAELVLRLNG
jgi:hypothetical protein